jgi:hypothetical protein
MPDNTQIQSENSTQESTEDTYRYCGNEHARIRIVDVEKKQ